MEFVYGIAERRQSLNGWIIKEIEIWYHHTDSPDELVAKPSIQRGIPLKIGKIQKNVTIPEVHSKVKYPWPEMEVGDSVLIQAEKGEKLYNLKRRVGPAARYYGQKTGKRFKTLIEHGSNGVRIWRVE